MRVALGERVGGVGEGSLGAAMMVLVDECGDIVRVEQSEQNTCSTEKYSHCAVSLRRGESKFLNKMSNVWHSCVGPPLKMKAIAVIVLVFSGARVEGKAIGPTCTQPPYRVWWNVNGKNFTNLDVSECVACPPTHSLHSTPLHSQSLHVPSTSRACSARSCLFAVTIWSLCPRSLFKDSHVLSPPHQRISLILDGWLCAPLTTDGACISTDPHARTCMCGHSGQHLC
jgi:hypothetical protein